MRKRLRKLLINWLVPDYEALKKDNENLKEEIRHIVNETEKGELIKLGYKLGYSLCDVVWYGDPSPRKFEGLKDFN
jgi:hypothetical protein